MSRDPEPGEPGYVEPPHVAAQREAELRERERAARHRRERAARRKLRKSRAQRRNEHRDARRGFPWRCPLPTTRVHLPPVVRPINRRIWKETA